MEKKEIRLSPKLLRGLMKEIEGLKIAKEEIEKFVVPGHFYLFFTCKVDISSNYDVKPRHQKKIRKIKLRSRRLDRAEEEARLLWIREELKNKENPSRVGQVILKNPRLVFIYEKSL